MNALLSFIEKLLVGAFALGFVSLIVIGLLRYHGSGEGEGGEAWREARRENTIESYFGFLHECKSCAREADAESALDELHRPYGLMTRLARGHMAERASISLPVFSPNGRTVLANGGDRPDFWDATTGARLPRPGDAFEVPEGVRVEALAYSSDGRQVAAGLSGAENGSLLAWDRQSGDLLAEQLIDGYDVQAVAFEPGNALLGWLAHGPVGIWEPGTGKFLRATHEGASALAFSRAANGRALMLTAAGRELWSWDANSMEPVHRAEIKSDRPLVGLSQDGRIIAYGEGPILELWDTRAVALVATLPAHDDDIVSFCRDPKRGWIVTGTKAGTLYLWDPAALAAPLGKVQVHEGPVEQLACSAQGRAVTVGWDGAKIWDLDKLRKGYAKNKPKQDE